MTTLQMIERHVRMAEELGRPIATAEQAHQMLKIGVTYSSTAETLANLGHPPYRRPGSMGFMVHETDEGSTQLRKEDADIFTQASGR